MDLNAKSERIEGRENRTVGAEWLLVTSSKVGLEISAFLFAELDENSNIVARWYETIAEYT